MAHEQERRSSGLLSRTGTDQPMSARQRKELKDRRQAAAMRLMGITPVDLEPVSSEVAELDEKRADILQGRREQLQLDLEEKALALTDEQVQQILMAEGPVDKSALTDKQRLHELKAQVDTMRSRNRTEAQLKAARQIEKRKQAEAFAKHWQIAAQQLKESRLREEQDALSRLEEKEKKLATRLAAQKAADNKTRRTIVSKLKEGEDRVQKNLDERAREREESRQRHANRHQYVAERVEQHEEDLRQLNMQRRQQAEEHIERVRLFRESQREYFAKREEERTKAYATKMAKVEQTMQDRAEKLEKDLAQHLDKMKSARQTAEESKDKVRERVQQQVEGRRRKWTNNVQALSTQRREKVASLKQALVTKFERSEAGRSNYKEETVGKHSKVRTLFKELVDMNKARIERSTECARELTLANIQTARAKHELMGEEKVAAEKYRAEAVKDALSDRALLEELCERVSPKRVAVIAEKLGLPPLSQDGSGGGAIEDAEHRA
mmetsp:Transcript_6276/g.15030  ORF Transcript_6276/g.15030 Transcript_6276/m.15030 type:complete len:496 (+) Transcript_6276:53-1540(+)